jgi:hypothetical protein
MGNQQILLIVLSVVIIGIAISTGFTMMKYKNIAANREAIIQDMYNLATQSIIFYKTPVNQGGGGGSWNTDYFYQTCGFPLTKNGKRIITNNGEIRITENVKGQLIIDGFGSQIGIEEEDAIRARLTLKGSDSEDFQFKLLD